MTIIVISGGLSHERDVSLRSGRRVAQALRLIGRDVLETDVNSDLIGLLRENSDAVVLPMLHGGLGEDGALREVLDLFNIPYVGASGAASRLAFDKSLATPIVADAGLATPRQVALPHEVFRELGAEYLMQRLGEELGFPLIVKPTKSGSALGTRKVETPAELPSAMVGAYAYGQVAVVEECIPGVEVAVAVLERDGEPTALPPVEIRPKSGVYDYEARYTAGTTRFVTPAELPDDVLAAAQDLAVKAHQRLHLRHLSRMDLMITPEGKPVFLEANVAPGMTETSLVPLAFQAAGLDLGEVFGQLVDRARRS